MFLSFKFQLLLEFFYSQFQFLRRSHYVRHKEEQLVTYVNTIQLSFRTFHVTEYTSTYIWRHGSKFHSICYSWIGVISQINTRIDYYGLDDLWLWPWSTLYTPLLKGVTKGIIRSDHVANMLSRNFHRLCRAGYETTVPSFSSAYSRFVRFSHNVGCQKGMSLPAYFQILLMVNCMLTLVHSTLYLQMSGQFTLLWQKLSFFLWEHIMLCFWFIVM